MRSLRITSSPTSAVRGPGWRAYSAVGGTTRARLNMLSAIAERDRLTLALLSLWALLFGVLVAGMPKLVTGALAAVVVLTLAVTAPLTVLLLLLALTAIVPYEVQHPLAIGATQSSPGLLPSDALLAAGLLAAILMLPSLPLDRRRACSVGVMICFAAVSAAQAVHGLLLGASVSYVGSELRHLLGFATLLLALPILDDPRARRHLFAGMLVLGLVLGLWGLAQWTLDLQFGFAGDVGVRPGVASTSSGSGQLQGGLFVYPVIVLLALAALLCGELRSRAARTLVVVVLALNCVDLVLTFERSFWLGTAAGAVLLFVRGGRRARRRVLLWMPVAIVAAAAALALSPSTLETAQQRLFSVGRYTSDKSVHYRVIESEHVLARIRAHPITGSGLGATIYWGRLEEGVPPKAYYYSHDGYLWLAWKIGIPGAVLIVGLMLASLLWRGARAEEPELRAARVGSQATLLALLIVCVTFPIFNTLELTCLAGLLLAMSTLPLRSAWAAPALSRLKPRQSTSARGASAPATARP